MGWCFIKEGLIYQNDGEEMGSSSLVLSWGDIKKSSLSPRGDVPNILMSPEIILQIPRVVLSDTVEAKDPICRAQKCGEQTATRVWI